MGMDNLKAPDADLGRCVAECDEAALRVRPARCGAQSAVALVRVPAVAPQFIQDVR